MTPVGHELAHSQSRPVGGQRPSVMLSHRATRFSLSALPELLRARQLVKYRFPFSAAAACLDLTLLTRQPLPGVFSSLLPDRVKAPEGQGPLPGRASTALGGRSAAHAASVASTLWWPDLCFQSQRLSREVRGRWEAEGGALGAPSDSRASIDARAKPHVHCSDLALRSSKM